MPLNIVRSNAELLSLARKAEADNDLPAAIRYYDQLIKNDPHDANAYTRLMIIYRRQKNYEAELKIIHKAIKSFEQLYEKRKEKLMKKNKQVSSISKALLKSLSKNSEQFIPEPIASWMKRKDMVEKKLGKS